MRIPWAAECLFPSRRRRARGSRRLLAHLAALERIERPRTPSARARLEDELGTALLLELERELGLEGRLALRGPGRSGRLRDAA
ncbi:MAG: hypothetical protein IT201_00875 [Thermoleophilia bacterium]|nr:hypothetical protein [Thermoleophilia bacterium]